MTTENAGVPTDGATAINVALRARYAAALGAWSSAVAGERVSQPLLVVVPRGYVQSRVRLMIVGQETLGWGEPEWDPSTCDGREKLYSWYEDFDLAHGRRESGSPFWQAAYKLEAALNPDGPSRSFLWTNVVPVSQDVSGTGRFGRPDSAVARSACGVNLLPIEVEVTHPDAIVFFSGKSRDVYLRESFPNATLTELDPLVGELGNMPKDVIAYRTEHPRRLRGLRQSAVIDQIAVRIAQRLAARDA